MQVALGKTSFHSLKGLLVVRIRLAFVATVAKEIKRYTDRHHRLNRAKDSERSYRTKQNPPKPAAKTRSGLVFDAKRLEDRLMAGSCATIPPKRQPELSYLRSSAAIFPHRPLKAVMREYYLTMKRAYFMMLSR
jgi:hypothetical protein